MCHCGAESKFVVWFPNNVLLTWDSFGVVGKSVVPPLFCLHARNITYLNVVCNARPTIYSFILHSQAHLHCRTPDT